jgi:hypothetical protein
MIKKKKNNVFSIKGLVLLSIIISSIGLGVMPLLVVADGTPPVITSEPPDTVYYERGTTGNRLYWTATDEEPGFYQYLIGTDFYPGSSWSNGVPFSINIDGLSVGNHDVWMAIYDVTGAPDSVGDAVTIVVQPDTTDPVITQAPSDLTYQVGTTGHTLTWKATDTNPDVYDYQIDGPPVTRKSWNSGSSYSVNVDGLSVGTHLLWMVFYDDYGNSVSDGVDITVNPDTTDPVITISPADLTYMVGTTGHTLTWRATDNNPDVYDYQIDGPPVTRKSWSSGTSFSVNVDGLSIGTHLVWMVIYDDYGNSVSDGVDITVNPDTNAPVFTQTPSDITYTVNTVGHSLTWRATDLSTPGMYDISLNVDTNIIKSGWWDSGDPITVNVDGLGIGTHTVMCAAYDSEGNPAFNTAQVTVQASSPPTLPSWKYYGYYYVLENSPNASFPKWEDLSYLNSEDDIDGVESFTNMIHIRWHAPDYYKDYIYDNTKLRMVIELDDHDITQSGIEDQIDDFDQYNKYGDRILAFYVDEPGAARNGITYNGLKNWVNRVDNKISSKYPREDIKTCALFSYLWSYHPTDPDYQQFLYRIPSNLDIVGIEPHAYPYAGASEANIDNLITNRMQLDYAWANKYNKPIMLVAQSFDYDTGGTPESTDDYDGEMLYPGNYQTYIDLALTEPLTLGVWWWYYPDARNYDSAPKNVWAKHQQLASSLIKTYAPSFTSTPTDFTYELGSTGNILLWTCTDDVPGNYDILRNSNIVKSSTWTSGNAITYNVDGLGIGTYHFEIGVYDIFGNMAWDEVYVTVGDTITPVYTSTPTDITYEVGTTGHTLSWTATDANSDHYEYLIDGSWTGSGPWTSGNPFSINVDGLNIGTYSYWMVVIDVAGNSVGDEVIVTVIADSTAPNIMSAPADTTYVVNSIGNTLTWTWNDMDPDHYEYTINGVWTGSGPWMSGVPFIANIEGLAVGTHDILCAAYDASGNVGYDQVQVTVLADTPPSIPSWKYHGFFTVKTYTISEWTDESGDLHRQYGETYDGATGAVDNVSSFTNYVMVHWDKFWELPRAQSYYDYINHIYENTNLNIIIGLEIDRDNPNPTLADLRTQMDNIDPDSLYGDRILAFYMGEPGRPGTTTGTDPQTAPPTKFTYNVLKQWGDSVHTASQQKYGHEIKTFVGFCRLWDFSSVWPDRQEYRYRIPPNIDIIGIQFDPWIGLNQNNVPEPTISDFNTEITSNMAFHYQWANQWNKLIMYVGSAIDSTDGDTPMWMLKPDNMELMKNLALNEPLTMGMLWYWYPAAHRNTGVWDKLQIIGNDLIKTTPPALASAPVDFTYELGSNGNSLSWTWTDGVPDVYNILRNSNSINSGSWTSGNPININIDGLAVGTYHFEIQVHDIFGNMAWDEVYITVQDTTVPNINSAPTDITYELDATGNTLSWAATDLTPDIFEYEIDGVWTGSSSWTSGVPFSINVDGHGIGTYYYWMVIYDSNGNSAGIGVYVTVVDSTVPNIATLPADITYELGSTGNDISWTWTDLLPDTYEIRRDGIIIDSGSWNSGNPININIDGEGIGSYSYTITIYDTSGNSASDSVQVSVIDSIAPQIVITPSDITYEFNSTGYNISWTWTDLAPDIYNILRNGTSIDTALWTSGDPITISIDGLGVGTYNYEIVVYDTSGNINSHNLLVSVLNLTESLLDVPVIQPIETSVINDGIVVLNWSEILDATTYYVYRADSNITSVDGLNPIISVSNSSYTDILDKNGYYYYVIVAGNAVKNSTISNCIEVRIKLKKHLTPPGNGKKQDTGIMSVIIFSGVIGAIGFVATFKYNNVRKKKKIAKSRKRDSSKLVEIKIGNPLIKKINSLNTSDTLKPSSNIDAINQKIKDMKIKLDKWEGKSV